jgi:hypothetical protein
MSPKVVSTAGCPFFILPCMLVYAVVDDSLTRHPLGDSIED